ncbi:MAG: hypothetical protein IK095_05095 [Oscillospiraceae bacterium]|nr:hypothetical protein [Oscillospiraceae bacterium]
MDVLKALQAAETVLGLLGAGYLLWHLGLVRALERRQIRQIRAQERPRQELTRRDLVRGYLLNCLDGLAMGWLVFALIAKLLDRTFGAAIDLRWHLILFSILALALLSSGVTAARKARRIRRGDYRLRRYTLSGYRTSPGPKGRPNYTYYLGTNAGDYAVVTPLGLKDGNWYYVVVMDGRAELALLAERWMPDWELRRQMPAEDLDAERHDR